MAAKCKTPGRKGPKRQPAARDRKPAKLDDEMLELASVISEFQLDNNVFGWFRPPWRNGWCAVELAFEAWLLLFRATSTEVSQGVGRYFKVVVDRKLTSNESYMQASDDLTALSLHGGDGAQMLMAAIRCYQVFLANSSGGGEVYNEILKRAFDSLDPIGIEDLILDWRCLDAIGTTPSLRQDANDRLRRAFITAWRRGLYLAAYSLPPSVDYTSKPQLVKE